jgi:hypothetical protein
MINCSIKMSRFDHVDGALANRPSITGATLSKKSRQKSCIPTFSSRFHGPAAQRVLFGRRLRDRVRSPSPAYSHMVVGDPFIMTVLEVQPPAGGLAGGGGGGGGAPPLATNIPFA